MKRFFFLILCAAGAVLMNAATIAVMPGTGTLNAAIAEAAAGDILELTDGTYTENLALKPMVPLTVRAAKNTRPFLSLSSRIEVKADFTMDGLQVKSSGEIIRMLDAATPYDVTVTNCEMSNCPNHYLRAYTTTAEAPYINSLTVTNCLFRMARESDTGSPRAIMASKMLNQLKSLDVRNCTFDGGARGAGRFIYLHPGEGIEEPVAPAGTVYIDHCTFFNTADTRGVYLANINGAHVTNCLFANLNPVTNGAGYALYGTNSLIENSLSWLAPLKLSTGATALHCINRNPYFVDAANGNFQLYANSPAVHAGTDGSNLGDPRWGVSDEEYDLAHEPYKPYKMPYSMAPTTTSVKVLWQMSEEMDATPATVCYGTDSAHLDLSVTTSDGWNVADEGYVHIVTLTGLQPNTRYYFTVGANDTRRCPKISWTKTAPEAGTAYRIFSISDIHGNACNNWSNMQDFICALNCDIALMNGDFVSSKGNDRNWNNYYFTPGEKFLGQVPVMSSVGNHETGDPFTYRWASYYDYFHQFAHEGAPEDSVKDPRGEAYFHFVYGNADVIMLNINGDPSSPDFLPGSRQYAWADSMLAACDRPWIIVCHHVGMWTSGYHGQWSDEPKQFSKLFEKHAALGKRILSLSGDDHSFEHIYKDGVHYVRPGCGRDANYNQQTQLRDAKYSLFYRRVSCFSTLDMTADASHIYLTAYDSVGTVFYTYDFSLETWGLPATPSPTSLVPEKLLRDGTVYIRRSSQLFTLLGQRAKEE